MRKEIRKKKITVVLEEQDPSKAVILKEIGRSVGRLKRFFKIADFGIKIYLAYSREEFDLLLGRKTATWEVGSANCPKNKIYLFSPLVFEKISPHKTEDFPGVLTHELVHLYTYQISPFYEPKWVREGLAYFLAGQGKPDFRERVKLKLKDNFLTQIDTRKVWEKNLHKGAYQLSFQWTNFLIKKFGQKRILEFLKKISPPYSEWNSIYQFTNCYKYRKFARVFEQIYHEDLDSLQIKFLKNYFFQNQKRKEVR